jgi:hypothetical protein
VPDPTEKRGFEPDRFCALVVQDRTKKQQLRAAVNPASVVSELNFFINRANPISD